MHGYLLELRSRSNSIYPRRNFLRYMIVSDKGGGANNAGFVGPVDIELSQLDFVYPTYRMEKAYVDQVRLPKQLYFHTWCPRLVQKSLTDDAGTLELLHNADHDDTEKDDSLFYRLAFG